MNSWEKNLAAWGLAEVGRWNEATQYAEHSPGLTEVIALRGKQNFQATHPVMAGWQSYYRGDYRTALESFNRYLNSPSASFWSIGFTELGMAKIASDCGRWQAGLDWCAKAWNSASNGEYNDLFPQIAGARGEILLRAGRAGDAAAAFSEDYGLLPAGSTFRGRVRCYQAHCWSRLGSNGTDAALLAYRIAIHSPGEPETSAFAAAGLALLAARIGNRALMEETNGIELTGIMAYWKAVATARLSTDENERTALIQQAAASLPTYYFAERWWFAGWTESQGISLIETPDLATVLGVSIPPILPSKWTGVEAPLSSLEITDAPWWKTGLQPVTADDWWALRDAFMP